jgi:hypothetical protein
MEVSVISRTMRLRMKSELINVLGEKKDYGNRHEETTSGSRTTRRTDTEATGACFVNILAATVQAEQASDAGRAS